MKKTNKKLQEEKAITLIVLVITIIILLILSGVSIVALSGNNGILTQATKSKEETSKAEKEEKKKLTMIEAAMNLERFKYTDSNNETVTIPAECAVSTLDEENTVANGLVIIDKNGNEWVWIPCTITEYNVADNSWTSGGYSDKTWNDSQATDIGTASVIKNGGFFISRYEAGIPENMIGVYANTDGETYTIADKKNVGNYTSVSKRGVQAWNFISQTNAQEVASKMLENNTVKSYLIDSYAWNATCRKISETKNITDSTIWGNYYNNITTAYEKLNTLFALHTYNNNASNYSKGKIIGESKSSENNILELSTGASKDFNAYNVYDMAGNMWEWTTEIATVSGINYAILRGGSFADYGNYYSVVSRNGGVSIDTCYVNIGFRNVLYIK